MKTKSTKLSDIKRIWHLVDCKNETLGRVSTRIAQLLIGKNKPYYTPNLDCGDYVVVINTKSVKVTGNKANEKLYQHHTGHPGGFREINFSDLMDKNPNLILIESVKGMLPKNKLRDLRLKRMKLYVNSIHPYENQVVKKEE